MTMPKITAGILGAILDDECLPQLLLTLNEDGVPSFHTTMTDAQLADAMEEFTEILRATGSRPEVKG